MKLSEKAKHVTCGVVMGAMLATAVPATARLQNPFKSPTTTLKL